MPESSPGHDDGCWGAHTADVTCASVIALRAHHQKYGCPWTCEKNPRSPYRSSSPDDEDVCRHCGARFSELPVDAPPPPDLEFVTGAGGGV